MNYIVPVGTHVFPVGRLRGETWESFIAGRAQGAHGFFQRTTIREWKEDADRIVSYMAEDSVQYWIMPLTHPHWIAFLVCHDDVNDDLPF